MSIQLNSIRDMLIIFYFYYNYLHKLIKSSVLVSVRLFTDNGKSYNNENLLSHYYYRDDMFSINKAGLNSGFVKIQMLIKLFAVFVNVIF
jgi:hypothetical protein